MDEIITEEQIEADRIARRAARMKTGVVRTTVEQPVVTPVPAELDINIDAQIEADRIARRTVREAAKTEMPIEAPRVFKPTVSAEQLQTVDEGTAQKAVQQQIARRGGNPLSPEETNAIYTKQITDSRERRNAPTDVSFTEGGANKFSTTPIIGFSSIREMALHDLQVRAPEFLSSPDENVRTSYQQTLLRANQARNSAGFGKILVKVNADGSLSNPTKGDLLKDIFTRQPVMLSISEDSKAFASDEEREQHEKILAATETSLPTLYANPVMPIRGTPQISETPLEVLLRTANASSAFMSKAYDTANMWLDTVMNSGPEVKPLDAVADMFVLPEQRKDTLLDPNGETIMTRLTPVVSDGSDSFLYKMERADTGISEALRDAAKGVTLGDTLTRDNALEKAAAWYLDLTTLDSVVPPEKTAEFAHNAVPYLGAAAGLGVEIANPLMWFDAPIFMTNKALGLAGKVLAKSERVGVTLEKTTKMASDLWGNPEFWIRASLESATSSATNDMGLILSKLERQEALTTAEKLKAIMFTSDPDVARKVRTATVGTDGIPTVYGEIATASGEKVKGYFKVTDLQKYETEMAKALALLDDFAGKAKNGTAQDIAGLLESYSTILKQGVDGATLDGAAEAMRSIVNFEAGSLFIRSDWAVDEIKSTVMATLRKEISLTPQPTGAATESTFRFIMPKGVGIADVQTSAPSLLSFVDSFAEGSTTVNRLAYLAGLGDVTTALPQATDLGRQLLEKQHAVAKDMLSFARMQRGSTMTEGQIAIDWLVSRYKTVAEGEQLGKYLARGELETLGKILFGTERQTDFSRYVVKAFEAAPDNAVEMIDSMVRGFAHESSLRLTDNDIIQAVHTRKVTEEFANAPVRTGLSAENVAAKGVAYGSYSRMARERVGQIANNLVGGTGWILPNTTDLNRWVDTVVSSYSAVMESGATADAWAKAYKLAREGKFAGETAPPLSSGAFHTARATHVTDDLERAFTWAVNPTMKQFLYDRISFNGESIYNIIGKKVDSTLRGTVYNLEFTRQIEAGTPELAARNIALAKANDLNVSRAPGLNSTTWDRMAAQLGTDVARWAKMTNKLIVHREAAAKIAIAKSTYNRKQDPGHIYGDTATAGFLVGRTKDTQYSIGVPYISTVVKAVKVMQEADNFYEGYISAENLGSAVFESVTTGAAGDASIKLGKTQLAMATMLRAVANDPESMEAMVTMLNLTPVAPSLSETAGLAEDPYAWNKVPLDPKAIAIRNDKIGVYHAFAPSEFTEAVLDVMLAPVPEETLRVALTLANTLDQGGMLSTGALTSDPKLSKAVLEIVMTLVHADIVRAEAPAVRQLQIEYEKYVTAVPEIEALE